MKEILFKRLAALLSVKSLVTLTLTGVFAYLSVIGKVEMKDVFLTIIGFYFGTQTPSNKEEK